MRSGSDRNTQEQQSFQIERRKLANYMRRIKILHSIFFLFLESRFNVDSAVVLAKISFFGT